MSDFYPMTMKQQQILDGYTCERLTDNSENGSLLFNFCNRKMPHLADQIMRYGWEEDRRGYPIAYYIVKNPDGEIAMIFSLRCGVLFDADSLKQLMEKKERYDMLIASMGNEHFTDQMRRELMELYGEVQHYEFLMKDMQFDTNRSMVRVAESYPAIELVHFCLNDRVRDEWRRSDMGNRTMGETLFWYFLVPKVQEIANLVGCQYLYTFVADTSLDGTLMNFFRTALHFSVSEHLGTAKPQFDFMCPMVYQPIYPMDASEVAHKEDGAENFRGIAQWRRDFFRCFNIGWDSESFV